MWVGHGCAWVGGGGVRSIAIKDGGRWVLTGGADRVTENISLNFAQFTYEYTPQNEKGEKEAAIPMGWDIAKNCEAS